MNSDRYSEHLISECKQIFNELFKHYLAAKRVAFDYEYNNEKRTSVPETTPTVGYILHLINAFHPSFHKVIDGCFKLPCRKKDEFVRYAVSFCDVLMRNGFPFLNDTFGIKNIPYLCFLMACAFIGDLLYFCMEKNCFKYMTSASKGLMVVYDRYLSRSFLEAGGWQGLYDFCGDALPVCECLPNLMTERIMGLPKHGTEVTNIIKSIEVCVVDYRQLTALSDFESQMILEDTRNDKSGSCLVCLSRCRWHLDSFTRQLEDCCVSSNSNDDDL